VTERNAHLLDLTPYISDVDSPASSLSLSTASPHATVLGLTLVLNYPPGVANDSLLFNVSDGLNSTAGRVSVRVLPFNAPPGILPVPAITFAEDREYNLTLDGFVLDDLTPASEIVWNVTSVSAGTPPIFRAYISDRSTLRVAGSPDASGSGSLVLVAIDGNGRSDTRTVPVNVTPVNDPPSVARLPVLRVLAGASAPFDLSPFVADTDTPLSSLKVTSSSPLVQDLRGLALTVAVRADASEPEIPLQVSVSDGSETVSAELTVRVLFPPAITPTVPNLRTEENRVLSFSLIRHVDRKSVV
jgi:hypothetical protein